MRARHAPHEAMNELILSDPPQVAVIDEGLCIGCTLCIKACPVDAIAGAAKLMHTVIAEECTGCRLCIPPCPVDCIAMVDAAGPRRGAERAEHAQRRYLARAARLASSGKERAGRPDGRSEAQQRKRATIERVMQRARERLKRR
jgi:electron transport complex protein RnfB